MTHTLERRKLEVFFAMVTAGFGLWLLFPSQAMVSPALGGLLRMTPECRIMGMLIA